MKHLKKKCLSLFFLLLVFLTKNKPLLLFQLSFCSRPLPPFSQGDAEKHCLAFSCHAARFLLRALCVGWRWWGSGESRQGCTNSAVSCFRRAWTRALGSGWAEQWEPRAQGPGKALPSSFVIYSTKPSSSREILWRPPRKDWEPLHKHWPSGLVASSLQGGQGAAALWCLLRRRKSKLWMRRKRQCLEILYLGLIVVTW